MQISLIKSVSRDAESYHWVGNCKDWQIQAEALFAAIYSKEFMGSVFKSSTTPVLLEIAKLEPETHNKFLVCGWSLAYESGSTKEKGRAYLFDSERLVVVNWGIHTGEVETWWVVIINNPTFAMVQSIDRGMARRMTFCVDGKEFCGEDLLNTFLMGSCSEVVFKPIKTFQTAGCVSVDCLRKALYVAKKDNREVFCCDRPDCMQTAAKILV